METQIRNKAKEDMKIEATEAGILKVAEENALESLEQLLSGMDIKLK
jgi:glutamine amidotransferase PdxT